MTQLPISLNQEAHKSDVRAQFAALCYRVKKDEIEVLLITSRRSGRWIVPKGWPMDGKTPGQCAAIEAWQEAGVTGTSSERCLGLFSYSKALDDEMQMPCVAMVFPLRVEKLKKNYPEAQERRRKWVSRKKAAKLLREPELSEIVRRFDPATL